MALQDDGWYLRADIIWSKGNPMPERVRDRPTRSHEYLFLFSNKPKYFYDAEAIAEEAIEPLESVMLANGSTVPCDVLFAHPPHRQVDLVRALGIALDDNGYVKVAPSKRETSIAGIYAAGDLTTRMQGAIWAAAAASQTAAMINVELTMELASSGAL